MWSIYRFSRYSNRSTAHWSYWSANRRAQRYIGWRFIAKAWGVGGNLWTSMTIYSWRTMLCSRTQCSKLLWYSVFVDDRQRIQYFGPGDEFDWHRHLFGCLHHGSQLQAECCGHFRWHHFVHSDHWELGIGRLVEGMPSFLLKSSELIFETHIFFSQIFISYVDLMDPTEVRRQQLKDNYYFLCECARCLGKNHINSLMLSCNKLISF